jgi:hypothetical protein
LDVAKGEGSKGTVISLWVPWAPHVLMGRLR